MQLFPRMMTFQAKSHKSSKLGKHHQFGRLKTQFTRAVMFHNVICDRVGEAPFT